VHGQAVTYCSVVSFLGLATLLFKKTIMRKSIYFQTLSQHSAGFTHQTVQAPAMPCHHNYAAIENSAVPQNCAV